MKAVKATGKMAGFSAEVGNSIAPMNAPKTYFAHTAPVGQPWEQLPKHLGEVAKLCARFAAAFDAKPWGKLAGLWHDLGKYSDDFQQYLRNATNPDLHQAQMSGKVDHATAGAIHALDVFGGDKKIAAIILSYVITGHHGGLKDWREQDGRPPLEERLKKEVPAWKHNAPKAIYEQNKPPLPALPPVHDNESQRQIFRLAMWIRMLFSCLCDADFLATEGFMSPDRSQQRPDGFELSALEHCLSRHLQRLSSDAPATSVNAIRAEILQRCESAAANTPGFFTLAVTTGGGKTLASMAFALRHAGLHDLRRVVVAIPFTSIIEQNAQVYRDIFSEVDPQAVLEHRSNLDPTRPENESVTTRLQTENWDAPIIVTTNVQFLESLFAAKTSTCRKLHRLARSVIILDEVQTLPIELLKSTLWALRELVEVYHCSIVMCSATQPALIKSDEFPIGLDSAHPIVTADDQLHQRLKRTQVEVIGTCDDDTLVDKMLSEDQCLCIVNTTAHAAHIADLLGPDPAHFHLSTRMCPAHRIQVLTQVRALLAAGQACRLVSTQLIEAGVDVDFAAVFRDQCGLDSLTQAAGRCNREGKRDTGRVVFFQSAEPPPPGHLQQSAATSREVLKDHADDPLNPEAIEQYFRLYYWQQQSRWDLHGVLDKDVLPHSGPHFLSSKIQFAEIADRYRLIRNEQIDIIIPWDETAQKLCDHLQRNIPLNRQQWRQLQRYTVGVRSKVRDLLINQGAISPCQELWILCDDKLYCANRGLNIEAITGRRDANDNII